MFNKQTLDVISSHSKGHIEESSFLNILKNEHVCTHFQPVLSSKRRHIVGFEALTRVHGTTAPPMAPSDLFTAAIKFNCITEIDRLCRSKALKTFRAIRNTLPPKLEPLLFLNINPCILDQRASVPGALLKQAQIEDIEPKNIVIEIVESSVYNLDALKRFIEFYRKHGFMIALDDVGAGHSNFDRFAIIRPDIIKIDRSIICDINKDFYKQEIFKALVQLSRKIGTLVLAEGVETKEEALCTMNYDADMLQGYYFARPAPDWEQITKQLGNKPRKVGEKLRDYKIHRINCIKDKYKLFKQSIDEIINQLSKMAPNKFTCFLKKHIKNLPFIEAIYVLNDNGVMETDAILQNNVPVRNSRLFQLSRRGDDLSLKEYFYLPYFSGIKHFTTDSYTSMATGNLIRTISCTFSSLSGKLYILCVDMPEEVTTCPLI